MSRPPLESSGRRFGPFKPCHSVVALIVAVAALGSGCSNTPAVAPQRETTAPQAPQRNLERVPDAVPRVEPIRSGGPNRPYRIDGRDFVPQTDDRALRERGLASWYGQPFHGRLTAGGETYDMFAMSAAHTTMPLPSYARVRNPANGREVVVRVNDRGPFVPGRVIDLSYTAALKLGLLRGPGIVEVERITNREIEATSSR